MRLEHLRPNFAKMTHEGQLEFMSTYRKKREHDLTTAVPLPPKAAKKILANGVGTGSATPRGKKEKMIPVTPEALEMLKKLGLI